MEVTMSSTQTMNELATGMAPTGTVDLKVEVVVIPVADVDRSKRFLATMKELLREAEARHGEYEPTAAPVAGVVCRIHRGAPTREDFRRGGQLCRAPD
jgi:hypothetical protein